MIPAAAALQRLRAGNLRFVDGVRAAGQSTAAQRRRELVHGQQPFAIVLGCSDSRVPAELVFDQGLGDLFVIRVAGNIVAPSQIGSVEFAAERFGTRLVVVMGHSRCGAVQATLEELGRTSSEPSRHLRSIVERIRPAVEPLLESMVQHDTDTVLRLAVRANVRKSADQLRHGSEVLEHLVEHEQLFVIGGEYDLDSGVVEFFDGLPAQPAGA